jgi:hypothetical protein
MVLSSARMSLPENSALKTFIARIGDALVFAQIFIRRTNRGYELRHVDDRERDSATLRSISPNETRAISQFTTTGAFRPLKSAPNLQSGWKLEITSDADLEFALNQFYPNAIADRFAADSDSPPITDFRPFVSRQTGMYRVAAMLVDEQASHAIRACCNCKFCLKQRLWTVDGLPTDLPQEKSLIPCLEPCALLLELARKAMRIEQQNKIQLAIAPDDLTSVIAGLELALTTSAAGAREADFNAAENSRRLQLTLEKLRACGTELANASEEE